MSSWLAWNYVSQAGLELMTLLSQFASCWDYRCVSQACVQGTNCCIEKRVAGGIGEVRRAGENNPAALQVGR